MAPNMKAVDRYGLCLFSFVLFLFIQFIMLIFFFHFIFIYSLDDVRNRLKETETEFEKARRDAKEIAEQFEAVKQQR